MSLSKKEIIFKFFEENPKALYDEDIDKYLELLGVKKSTYKKNRIEFRSLIQVRNCTAINYIVNSKCEKKREKFIFDDSKLFEMSCR